MAIILITGAILIGTEAAGTDLTGGSAGAGTGAGVHGTGITVIHGTLGGTVGTTLLGDMIILGTEAVTTTTTTIADTNIIIHTTVLLTTAVAAADLTTKMTDTEETVEMLQ